VVLGGQVGVAGHLTIGDGAMIGAQAGVTGDIEPKSMMLGSPAVELRRFRRSATLFKKFPELLERIKRLEKFANFDPAPETSTESSESEL
jgi:UDP-3-O-[3-hydroxymyristoyl] glucosamine N-acyltransferase